MLLTTKDRSSVTLTRNLPLVASAGSYSYTGQSAAITKGHPLTAQAGSYAYTGSAATILRDYPIAASAGSYSYLGSSVDIIYDPGLVVYSLIASAGAYTYLGVAAELMVFRPYPPESDVRLGVVYGALGERTGTMAEYSAYMLDLDSGNLMRPLSPTLLIPL